MSGPSVSLKASSTVYLHTPVMFTNTQDSTPLVKYTRVFNKLYIHSLLVPPPPETRISETRFFRKNYIGNIVGRQAHTNKNGDVGKISLTSLSIDTHRSAFASPSVPVLEQTSAEICPRAYAIIPCCLPCVVLRYSILV